MSLVRVDPPDPIIALTEAKAHLRVDHDDDDTLIEGLVQAATDTIDGATGWLGRALGPQTWDWTLDDCAACSAALNYRQLALPMAPLISVDEIEYRNTSGALTAYTAFDVFGVNSAGYGSIRPNVDTTWPDIGEGGDALRVRFTAGYATESDDSPGVLVPAVPFAIKAAILLMVGDLYSFRETVLTGSVGAVPMSTTVESLLNPYRLWRA